MRHLVASDGKYLFQCNSWKKRVSGLIAVLACVIAGTLSAQQASAPPPPDSDQSSQPSMQEPPAANDVRAVRLSDVEGKVQVFNGADLAFDQAFQNMPVMEGMRFVTADDGRVEVQFEDGSVARVTPNSSITLSQLRRDGEGTTITTIDADTGLTYYELNGRGGRYSVRLGPNAVIPADSAIFRVNLDKDPADLAVTHGSVHVTDGQSLSIDVHTNESIRFGTQNSEQYQLLQSVAADTWDQWNSDRDQALATLGENETTARASTGNPDDAAWNDLDYYGDWYNVPGYGMAWAPSGVGAGWDPFGVGYWGYYGSVGYVWISGYSWGWWPYHCGAWNWFDGFGWMWFPGNCGFGAFGGGWYPYAAVWRCPSNYRPPQKPANLPGLGQHHKVKVEPMVAVNRGQQHGDVFRSFTGAKPAPRIFNYDGRSILPAESTIRVRNAGPIGEGFTAAITRTHPEVFGQSYVRPVSPVHTYQPGMGSSAGYAGSTYRSPASSYHPATTTPPRTVYAPSAPTHVSAPAPSSGGGHAS
ncbi:MAG: FecR domain-containing protein, partial [Silvibacterium sp.]|nr:FecR domain-containing protein [Silvibacterium sp.]